MATRRRKKQTSIYRALLLLAVLIGIGLVVRKLYFTKKEPKIWRGFGIEPPAGYSIQGIDISKYQHEIYWPYVKAMKDQNLQLKFAFIKATEGAASNDPWFEDNWRDSKENNLVRGAYHFYRPGESARLQAINFIENVAIDTGDLPPVLDAELDGNLQPEALRDSLCVWLSIVEKYYGMQPFIYTNSSFYNRILNGYFDAYPLWIAHYKTDQPNLKRNWAFWQYSENGRVNGIDAHVDFNAFSGDSAAFQALRYRD